MLTHQHARAGHPRLFPGLGILYYPRSSAVSHNLLNGGASGRHIHQPHCGPMPMLGVSEYEPPACPVMESFSQHSRHSLTSAALLRMVFQPSSSFIFPASKGRFLCPVPLAFDDSNPPFMFFCCLLFLFLLNIFLVLFFPRKQRERQKKEKKETLASDVFSFIREHNRTKTNLRLLWGPLISVSLLDPEGD